MPDELRDIRLPQIHLWENLLQPGFWLVLLVLGVLIWWCMRRYRHPFRRHKSRVLKQLATMSSISVADANALLMQLLAHKQARVRLNSNRDEWRRLLLGHNSRMPELAEQLAFYYRHSQPPDGRRLRDQLVNYIQQMQ